MTLDEKIRESIHNALEEQAQLFNDVDDVDEDARAALRAVKLLTPLLTDIKTEVKSIEDWVKAHPERVDQDEEDEEEEQDTSPEQAPEDVEEIVDDLVDAIPKQKSLRKKLRDALSKYTPPSKGGDLSKENNFPDLPKSLNAVDGLLPLELLALIIKAREQAKDDKARWAEIINLIKQMRAGEVDTKQFFKKFFEEEGEYWEDLWNRLSEDELDTIDNWLEQQTDNILEKIFQLGDNMGNCCHSLSDQIDDVDNAVGSVAREISQLEPLAQAGRELLVLQKSSAILSEMQAIRGLL